MTCFFYIFFFNDTATTEIYTLSLHDALPIFQHRAPGLAGALLHHPGARCSIIPDGHHVDYAVVAVAKKAMGGRLLDRKSTCLNSSHANISYAVFCLKKKKKTYRPFFINNYNT